MYSIPMLKWNFHKFACFNDKNGLLQAKISKYWVSMPFNNKKSKKYLNICWFCFKNDGDGSGTQSLFS